MGPYPVWIALEYFERLQTEDTDPQDVCDSLAVLTPNAHLCEDAQMASNEAEESAST